MRSGDWPSTKGKVVKAEMEVSSDLQYGTTYGADVVFKYHVDDRDYVGNKVSFDQYGSGDSSHVRGILNRYPVGSEVDVFYNPENPALAVLEPGLQYGWGIYLPFIVGIFFVGFAGYMLIHMYSSLKSMERFNKGI